MRDSAGRLVVPLTLLRTCEGEDCTQSFAAIACFAAELHRAPLESAPVVAHIARGDTVQVTRQDLRVLQPGIVVFRRPYTLSTDQSGDADDRARADTVRFAAGDTLYLLQYLALGDWSWWHRGKLDSSDQFWASEDDGGFGASRKITDTSTAVRLSRPVSQDWWLVARPSGASGWWLADTLGALRSIDLMAHWEEHCPPPDSAAVPSR